MKSYFHNHLTYKLQAYTQNYYVTNYFRKGTYWVYEHLHKNNMDNNIGFDPWQQLDPVLISFYIFFPSVFRINVEQETDEALPC